METRSEMELKHLTRFEEPMYVNSTVGVAVSSAGRATVWQNAWGFT